MSIKERFLKYVSFDTQSDPNSQTHPSSKKQFALGELLVEELHQMGITNAYIDEYCYVYAYIPSNCNSNKTVGLIAHMDTARDASGKDIKPRIIDFYTGQPIVINEELNVDIEINIKEVLDTSSEYVKEIPEKRKKTSKIKYVKQED